YSVFNLNRLSGSGKFDLYRRGILRLEDLPGDVPLSPGQRMQVEAEREGKRFIDRPRLRDFLRSFTPPLSFLDFETVQYAIPPFDGVRPYQQIPFQFSLHVQEGQADSLRHVEFLAAEGTDPRRALAERLAASVPETGSVVVYNSGFEKEILRGLARQVPACAHPLRRIHDRVVDLMVPF
ncbi:MAG: DUF2779 domain-containing protein, partial [Nitrospinaceae bacterium]|nr:DUF2779 domain-containing protein [Nitrospinaceae bacterium]NIR55336.1 DUF2779 domain-containing protein [Nitrospinaceae bacterium]NIS85775.1 DUF2779 domain-containing protein [Nitrospinaceae bacterium]NIT82625.1 DUF2779 domain-containing protein [Nitrospinaceae bacterium]NIU44830.1 DUF2779 domain-containing protein [Nitrospinaceae bacterium]